VKLPLKIKNKKKINAMATVIFLVSLIMVNFGFFIYKINNYPEFFIYVNDADRLSDGNTAIRVGDFYTTIKIAGGKERENCYSAIVEVDHSGKLLWEYTPEDQKKTHIDHEIVKKTFQGREGYYFTDCLEDKIKFVDIETKEVRWEYWIGDIDWKEINPDWDDNHYYNQSHIPDWTHINDIDFYDHGDWESMLISIRDFNLIVEVDFTSAQNRDRAETTDIKWWYGGDDILACPHNPGYLPNGNILIVDSDNLRIIEVEKKTKEIVWEWTDEEIMTWPRDCDLMPDGRNYIVTDTDEIFILNKDTGQVGLRIDFGGYEADYVENTNTILVGGDVAGEIREFDARTGREIWHWGSGNLRTITTVNLTIFILFEMYWCVIIFLTAKNKKWLKMIPLLVLTGIKLFIIFGFDIINVFFFIRTIC
jgi:hypothetical protein